MTLIDADEVLEIEIVGLVDRVGLSEIVKLLVVDIVELGVNEIVCVTEGDVEGLVFEGDTEIEADLEGVSEIVPLLELLLDIVGVLVSDLDCVEDFDMVLVCEEVLEIVLVCVGVVDEDRDIVCVLEPVLENAAVGDTVTDRDRVFESVGVRVVLYSKFPPV